MKPFHGALGALLTLFTVGPAAAAPDLPAFGAATFVPGTLIDHPYFPLLDNLTRTFEGSYEDEGETVTERFELSVVGAGPTLLGVQTVARRDRSYEDDLLVEDTFDYYAQDTDGNVWYFGEDVTNYIYDEDDNLIGTTNESAWLAGEDSALPGFIMPADLTPAFHYYQEFAPFNAALDHGQTLASDVELAIALGVFSDVLAVLELNPSDPDAREIKYYAPGVGLIAVDEGLSFDLEDPELRLELVSVATPVPLPAPVALLAGALAGLFATTRRLRA